MVLNSSSLTHFDIGFHIANVTGDECQNHKSLEKLFIAQVQEEI